MMVKLGDLGQIITGNTPKTNEKHNYNSKDICFVKPSDIDEENISLIEKSVFYISERARNKSKIVPKNSILVTCIGIIGKVAITNVECAFNQQINGIVLEESKCIPNYVAYAIQFQKKYIQEVANNAVVPILNKTQFSNIEISLPSLEEQRKIAKTLDKVSDLIAKRKQQLEKLDLFVKAKFVEMFGDPIQNTHNLPVTKLKDVSLLITNGNTPNGGGKNYIDNGIVFLRSQNVWKNKILLDDVAYISEELNRKMSKSIVNKYDILLTKTGRVNTENSSLGRAALYLGEDGTANINGHVYLIRLNQNYVMPDFIINILTSDFYREYIRKICVGGIDKRQINLEHVENFIIILPPIELQNKFVDFAQQTEKSKILINHSLEKLETLKKALMQEYFG